MSEVHDAAGRAITKALRLLDAGNYADCMARLGDAMGLVGQLTAGPSRTHAGTSGVNHVGVVANGGVGIHHGTLTIGGQR